MVQCIPIAKFWDRDIPGECNVQSGPFFLAVTIPNIVIDVVMLIVPVRHTIQLNLKRNTKFAVACIFLLGGL